MPSLLNKPTSPGWSVYALLSVCFKRKTCALLVGALALILNGGDYAALAANQTPDLTPISLGGSLPFRVTLRPYDFGQTELPTLHSFVAGQHDGKWLLLAGRTNGLHGFDRFNPQSNFPPQSQNRDIWVIDPVTKQSWRRSLQDASAGLNAAEVNSLSPTNTQFYQEGERLYVSGGYGVVSTNQDGTNNFGTFDTLSAIDLPEMIEWVMTGAGSAAAALRQVNDPIVKVTGGGMYPIGGTTHLVFGQAFDGPYTPQTNGVYTQQVRSFTIVDDGVNLAIENIASTAPQPDFRRRDLNVFPVLMPGAGPQLNEGLVALSGVFTTSNGAFTVPVEIDAIGAPTMEVPSHPATFKQGFNGYHSAKLGLFSESRGEMHEVLFGGIGVQFLDETSMQVMTDNALPFVNDITAVRIDAAGAFSQHHLGFFPAINDLGGKRLRFGANAEFFALPGVEAYDNGVIKLDAVRQETTLGYIFGGLAANGPHTRGVPGVVSSASNVVFEVVLTPAPEPASAIIGAGAALMVVAGRRAVRWSVRFK